MEIKIQKSRDEVIITIKNSEPVVKQSEEFDFLIEEMKEIFNNVDSREEVNMSEIDKGFENKEWVQGELFDAEPYRVSPASEFVEEEPRDPQDHPDPFVEITYVDEEFGETTMFIPAE